MVGSDTRTKSVGTTARSGWLEWRTHGCPKVTVPLVLMNELYFDLFLDLLSQVAMHFPTSCLTFSNTIFVHNLPFDDFSLRILASLVPPKEIFYYAIIQFGTMCD